MSLIIFILVTIGNLKNHLIILQSIFLAKKIV